jgi:Na+/proline symporter
MDLAPLVVGVMLLVLTGIGWRHSRKIRSGEDFALAGRGLSAAVLTGTLVATWIGTGSIFGNAQKAYEHGVAGFLLPISGLLGMLLLAKIAPRVRELPAKTVPGILGLRFGRSAQLLGAVALIGAYLIIVSYQYRAGAAVAERLFPSWDLGFTVGSREVTFWPVLCALFVIMYTALAGLWSVATTDVVAGFVIAVGVLGCLAITAGGFAAEGVSLPESYLRLGGGFGKMEWVGYMLPPFLLIIGDANLLQRFMAAKDPSTAKRAAWGAFVGLLIIESAIIALALVGKAQLAEAPANSAHVIVEVAFTLVPPLLGAVLAAAIVAVILSTADSFLLACSTSAATDFGSQKPGAESSTRRHRLSVILFGLAALGIAYTSDEFFSVALYAYTLYGVTLTPAMVAAIFFPNTKSNAVVGGMASGLVVAVAWKFLAPTTGALGQLDPVLPALFANVIVLLFLQRLSLRHSPSESPQ